MSDHLDSAEEPTADELAAIDALLARPDVWDDPPAELEDAVIAAITTEAASFDGGKAATDVPPAATSLDERRATRGTTRDTRAFPWWLGAAAACAIVVAGIAIAARGDGPSGTEIALAATEAAPGASAEAVLSSTPAGLKILLDVDGLRGAPDGYFYEAWVSDGTTRVSAGTFHLRGGDGPIELWAGVVDPGFRTLSVTLEPLDADTDSSGDVKLVGEFDLDTD